MDKISVLMCTYNAEKYIIEQLDSLKNQTYKNMRVIIYDDQSSDNTVDMIKNYINENADQLDICLHINDERSGGAANNFKKITADHSDEKYIFYCDQDDIWEANKIEKLMAKMVELEQNAMQPYIVCHNCAVADEQGNIYDHSHITNMTLYNLIYSPQVQGCCMMLNSLALQTMNMAQAEISMHDWYACLVVSATGHIEIVEDELIRYRQHANNQVGYNRESLWKRFKLLFDTKDKLKRYSLLLKQLYSVSLVADNMFLNDFHRYYDQKRAWKIICLFFKYGVLKPKVHGIYQMFVTMKALKFERE